MCRAIWVVVIAPSEEASRALRRAAGADAQVVATATATEEALGLFPATQADVVIVDGRVADAERIAREIRARAPDAAVLWVGEDVPAEAHHGVLRDDLDDVLPGAITKALLARAR